MSESLIQPSKLRGTDFDPMERPAMPVVLVDLDDGKGPRAPEPHGSDGADMPRDLPYFVAVARAAATRARGFERFVLSYTQRVGVTLGPRDVWFLIGDETATRLARPPTCPVFRTHGERFGVPWRGAHLDSSLAAAEVALWARNRGRGLWHAAPHLLATRRRGPLHWLPLGMPAWTTIPEGIPPIGARPFDVSFRGSLRGERSYAPKTLSRRRMAEALGRLPPIVAIDFSETKSFGASYSLDPGSYTEALLQTKLCLAPRGGSLETFRLFEGAVAGCVVITEPLPPAWFYAGLPRHEVRSWRELPHAVERLLENPLLLGQMSRAARDWARNVVSPEGVGRWVADRLSGGHNQSLWAPGPE